MKKKVLAILGIAAFAMLVSYNINMVINGDAPSTNVALVDVETLAHAVEQGCPMCYGSSTCAYHSHGSPGDGVGSGGSDGGSGDGGGNYTIITSTRTLWCSDGMYVIRCDYGYGNCDPSWQDLCSGHVSGWN